jgi:AraC-like DNA-binding protein
MDRTYTEPLDVPSLARIAAVSEAHFIRSFRATFGETPHRYLQQVFEARRLARARRHTRRCDRRRDRDFAPEPLFRAADKLAREQGTSSQLIATALAEYLRRRRDAEKTARLNEVYGHGDPEIEEETQAFVQFSKRQMRRIVGSDPWT